MLNEETLIILKSYFYSEVVTKLYKMFVETDATLLEINPFAETNDGKIMVCDAKINFGIIFFVVQFLIFLIINIQMIMPNFVKKKSSNVVILPKKIHARMKHISMI